MHHTLSRLWGVFIGDATRTILKCYIVGADYSIIFPTKYTNKARQSKQVNYGSGGFPAYPIMGFRTMPLNIEPLMLVPSTWILSGLVASVDVRFNRRILFSLMFVQYSMSSSQSTARSPMCVHVWVQKIYISD